MNKTMTWTLWSEFYTSRQTPGITAGNCLEPDLNFVAVLLLKYCYSPRPWLYPAKFWALPQPRDVHSIVSLKVMGHDHSLRGSTQKEPERAWWTSPGSLMCTYKYPVVNSPHYEVCTINTTNNLQITQIDEFLSISWAVQGSWAKSTSGTNRWTFLSTRSLKHHTGSKMLL